MINFVISDFSLTEKKKRHLVDYHPRNIKANFVVKFTSVVSDIIQYFPYSVLC